MKKPSKYQIKDYLSVLVCCCVKWEHPDGKAYVSVTWDNQKLHRLQTILDLKKESIEAIDDIKHDISVTNNWKIEGVLEFHLEAVPKEIHEQLFFVSLVIAGKASFTNELQFKSDFRILNIIKDAFSISSDRESDLIALAQSLSDFSQAIDKQYNFDLVK